MALSCLSSFRNRLYDIFPSFSGADVRKSFLSHFHKEMDRKMIVVFKDNDDIERSHSIKPELVQAIRGSRISVVVLSKNYASSSWCLDELLEIMKCKEVIGQAVIPIFYGLDPSDVRKQTGDFGKIFEETCKNRTEEVKNQWRKALTDVANMAGFDFSKCNNEAEMIEAIANVLLDKLNLTLSKNLGDLVGMEDHRAEMSRLLCLESDEVRRVGIWGPSGIGKTTIARYMFHRLAPHFQHSLFIDRAFFSKIMKTFSKANPFDYNKKLALQNEFLSKFLEKKDLRIDHLGAIEERVKNHKILLCIDDLYDPVVLEVLAGKSEWFANGSRIIAATYDKHLLAVNGIDDIYPVHLPLDHQALEIFCRAAFEQNYAPDGLMDFASEVVRLAGSLPLGLKILGSSLRGLGKKDCLDRMPGFRKGLNGDIERTLRVGYDGLGKKEKAIFRHIACLFNEHQVEDIKLLLADSELDVDVGLRNLEDKSLISVSYGWMVIQMNRLLEEMGKEIVREQSTESGEREFLWDPKDIAHVLEENTGTNKVLGIALNMDTIDELDVDERSFKEMKNLRFLIIKNGRLNNGYIGQGMARLHESLNYLPSTLKYLRWEYYPMKRMPSNFRPKNLVKLEMMYCIKLEKLWDGAESLPCLGHMDLSHSENLEEIPDLSKAANLEILYLRYCLSLTKLPYSIRNLNKLRVLNMEYCTKLETLPTGINLQSLHTLNLIGCSRLRTFPNISTNISYLALSKTAIEEVPRWIENFSRLKYLDMRGCSKLKYVHLDFSKLKHLDDADFYGCEALTRVDLRGCRSGVAMGADDASKFELDFTDGFKLDQDALHKQQVLLLPGRKVPSYFTHRTTSGMSLTNIPLLHTSLPQTSFRFRVCAKVYYIDSFERVAISVNFRLRRFHELFYSSGQQHQYKKREEFDHSSHLIIFDCYIHNVPLARLIDNDEVDTQTEIYVDMDMDISISPLSYGYGSDSVLGEWGVRLIEDCSSEEKLTFNPNTLPRVCQVDEVNMANETEHGDDDSDEVNWTDYSDKVDEFKIDVFKNEIKHCDKCDDPDGVNETYQSEECDVCEGNWDSVKLDFSGCSKLKGWGVRILEDYSLAQNQLGNSNTHPPLQRLLNETEHDEAASECR